MDYTENDVTLMLTEIEEQRKVISKLSKQINSLEKLVDRIQWDESGTYDFASSLEEISARVSKMVDLLPEPPEPKK